jgi:hypothetical protein
MKVKQSQQTVKKCKKRGYKKCQESEQKMKESDGT